MHYVTPEDLALIIGMKKFASDAREAERSEQYHEWLELLEYGAREAGFDVAIRGSRCEIRADKMKKYLGQQIGDFEICAKGQADQEALYHAWHDARKHCVKFIWLSSRGEANSAELVMSSKSGKTLANVQVDFESNDRDQEKLCFEARVALDYLVGRHFE